MWRESEGKLPWLVMDCLRRNQLWGFFASIFNYKQLWFLAILMVASVGGGKSTSSFDVMCEYGVFSVYFDAWRSYLYNVWVGRCCVFLMLSCRSKFAWVQSWKAVWLWSQFPSIPSSQFEVGLKGKTQIDFSWQFGWWDCRKGTQVDMFLLFPQVSKGHLKHIVG